MAVRTKGARVLLNQARLNRLTPTLERIAQLKVMMEEMAGELDALTEEVIAPLIAVDKTYTDKGITYTAVTPERAYYDEAEIRKAVGEEVWPTIRKESIDSKSLAAAILAGTVDKNVVAEHTEFKSTKPYVLVTRHADQIAQAS